MGGLKGETQINSNGYLAGPYLPLWHVFISGPLESGGSMRKKH